MQLPFFVFCIFLTFGLGCGPDHEEKPLSISPNSAALRVKFDQALAEAKDRQTQDGWLAVSECDAMLWTGKASCAVPGVVIEAAEYLKEPGRFNRRPTPFCEKDQGSDTSWSRDMGKGLFVYAWCNKDVKALERHAAYGSNNFWKMGQPLDDGKVVYVPGMIGQLYSLIKSLGGEDNPQRVWPDVYPAGKDDYEAHLQMIDVWIRGEVAAAEHDADAIPKKPDGVSLLGISQTMFNRVVEHSDREPLCPFYAYMRGLYDTGDLGPVTDLLLSDQWTCSYFHSDNRQDDVHLAEWLFVARQVLKHF